MSSFTRKIASTSQKLPAGTRPSQSLATLLLTSSGIPSFDDVLGGGIQLGTSLLVLNPDPHSAHTELLQKYFIAQGLACDQEVHVFDSAARNLVESCMWMPGPSMTSHAPDEEEAPDARKDKVKIAWRYERMQKFKTTVSSQTSDQEDYCRSFDLSSLISPAVVDDFLNAGRLHIKNDIIDGSEDVYETMIQYIENIVEPFDTMGSQSNKRVTRLCIHGFAGPLWGDTSPEKIVRFLLRLRLLLRRQPLACALISLPSHISAESWGGGGWIDKLGWVSDACISLNSHAADPSTAALFPSYHGLLKIHKLPCVQTLVSASDRFSSLRGLSSPTSASSSGGLGENNLAFKCTRKRFVIETLHLDVEGGVGERRTTPAASSGTFQEKREGDMSAQQLHSHNHEHGSAAAMQVRLDEEEELRRTQVTRDNLTTSAVQRKEGQKKPKKKVGFQVERPDLYDF